MAISKVTAAGIDNIAAAVEGASDSNKFTDDDHSKLNNIEPSATADQTAAQIKTALENGIDSVHYVDGSIDTAHIGDDQVTADKLANSINSAITANTAKTGITTSQANAITANTAKTGITSSQASAITANTAKTGITSSQATAITAALPKAGGAMTGTITNLRSTGIDDNANALAVTINSSEQVGIGQTSPAELLHLKGGTGNNSTAAPIVRIQKHSGGAVDDGQTIGGMSFWVNDDGVDSGAPKERAKIIAESQNTSSGTRLEFWTGNSNAAIAEQMRIQADGAVIVNNGITLGNGLTYAAANTLDDYEEGDFSITVSGSSSGSGNVTGTAYYTKVGRLCTVSVNFNSQTFPTLSGALQIGLPFTAGNKGEYHGADIYFLPTFLSGTVGSNFTGLIPHIAGANSIHTFMAKNLSADRQTNLSTGTNGSLSGASAMYARYSFTYVTA